MKNPATSVVGFFPGRASGEKHVGEVQEIEFAFRTGQCGVKPPQPFEVDSVLRHEALIDDDRGPLPTLAFVTGQGVGKLHLKSLVAGVRVRGFVDFGFAPKCT